MQANPAREEEWDRLIEEGEEMEVKGNEEETRVEEELAEAEQKRTFARRLDTAFSQTMPI